MERYVLGNALYLLFTHFLATYPFTATHLHDLCIKLAEPNMRLNLF
jgi:hypothetical protein